MAAADPGYLMKLIELRAHERVYLINPEQIAYVEAAGEGEGPYAVVYFNIPSKEGGSRFLRFNGDDANNLLEQLRKAAG